MIDLVMLGKMVRICSWILAALIMIVIAAIASFYQKKFRIRTFYYMYLIPIIVLFTAAFQIFPSPDVVYEAVELLGSASSFLASFFLYRKMVGIK